LKALKKEENPSFGYDHIKWKYDPEKIMQRPKAYMIS